MRAALFLSVILALAGCSRGYSTDVQDPPGLPIAFAACLPGTGDGRLAGYLCDDILTQLRARGFRTAKFRYPSLSGFHCLQITQKVLEVQAMVNAAARGLPTVVIGWSQGAWIAGQLQAKAALLYSDGTQVVSPTRIPLPCNDNAKSERVMAISGESDEVYRHPLEPQLAAITGAACAAAPCGENRGWRIVTDAEMQGGVARHGFAKDPSWLTSTADWSLQGGVDWLIMQVQLP
jgi:hypothetical protein